MDERIWSKIYKEIKDFDEFDDMKLTEQSHQKRRKASQSSQSNATVGKHEGRQVKKNNNRRSMFWNERSYSMSNLAIVTKPRSQSKPTIMEHEYSNQVKLSRKHNWKNFYDSNLVESNEVIYQIKNQPSIIEELSVVSSDFVENTEEADFIESTEDLSVTFDEIIQIEKVEFRLPRNSNDLKLDKRRSNMSEKGYKQSSFEDKITNHLQSAPESSRNSSHNPMMESTIEQSSIISTSSTSPGSYKMLSSLPKYNQTSKDSGISSVTVATKSSSQFNKNTPQSNAEHTLSRPSSFYDEIDRTKSNKEELEDKNKDGDTLKPSDFSKVKESNPITIKSVLSHEDQNQFFKQVAVNISETTYSKKEIIRFYKRDGTTTTQLIDRSQKSLDIIRNLKSKYNIASSTYCQLIEFINAESLERVIEDHEDILTIYYSWEDDYMNNKFIFQDNNMAYIIFTQPSAFKSEFDVNFEIQDNLWVKPIGPKWKKTNCFILDSIVYYTVKPGSKDHTDLFCLVNLKNWDFYLCIDPNRTKKVIKSPSNEVIVFKSDKSQHKASKNPCIGPLTATQREKWLQALRVSKFGIRQLKDNFLKQDETNSFSNFRSAASSFNLSSEETL